MFHYTFQNIPISHINSDPLFDWYPSPEDSTFQAPSQEPTSLLPFVVQHLGDQYRLIDGFKRLAGLRKYPEIAEIPALVFPGSASLFDLMLWRLENRHPTQNLKGWQLCRVVQLFKDYDNGEYALAEEILPKLGLPASKHMLKKLLQVAQDLTPNTHLLEAFAQSHHEELAALVRFSPKEQEILAQWKQALKVKGNKWKSIIDIVQDLDRADIATLTELHEHPDFLETLESAELAAPIRYRHVKSFLEQLRYPELTQARSDVDASIQKLQCPKGIQINYDPFLERVGVQIDMHVTSTKQVEIASEFFQATEPELWESLFEAIES